MDDIGDAEAITGTWLPLGVGRGSLSETAAWVTNEKSDRRVGAFAGCAGGATAWPARDLATV